MTSLSAPSHTKIKITWASAIIKESAKCQVCVAGEASPGKPSASPLRTLSSLSPGRSESPGLSG